MLENVILNLISVYAPQSGCDDVTKEKFWEDFDTITMDIPANEEIYVGGDFNGHVGRMNVGYERVHGGFGFGSRNVQDEALLQAVAAFDLAIANTWFQKRDEHLITYKSGKHTTQIDYFLVKRNKINCIKDIKIIPGEHLTSQHRLLVIDLYIKIHSLNRKERLPPKIRWKMLEKNECAEKFKERVIDKMIEMKDMEGLNANECWKEMANCIRRVAKDVLGESKGKGIIDKETWWWNEEVQEILKQKKQAFREWQKSKAGQGTEEAIKRTKYIE
ncbi:craniofacial development protein 2-like [Cydia pomonella]|uniref:craniofacial development protein 2-like n=1 Tax=Cydia pomonella TaxID=82600 RepID=UPI002ADE3515|nr:craniofacial development protein 2-like [Cydia pomonella]